MTSADESAKRTMKAVVYEKYGPPEVLEVREVEKPAPGDDDVLIRVRAAAVNTGDCEMRRPEIDGAIWFLVRIFFGLFKPRKNILGSYFAGEVESVGKNVTCVREGDRVYAASGARFGAYAEYVCLPSRCPIATMPSNMSFEEASVVPLGGLNALHYVRKSQIKAGAKMVINGAGGSFGTFAVQLAKNEGAEVIAVDSANKFDMLRSIGADHVVDYTKEDFTQRGESYDAIFDVVGKSPFSRSLKSLVKGGRYLIANPPGLFHMLRGVFASLTTSKKVVLQFASETTEELEHLTRLIEEGKLRSVIDKTFPLEQAVEAHRYVETGQKLGNVVLTMRD